MKFQWKFYYLSSSSLGAGHDGTDNATCPADDQYIMTPILEERMPDNFHNIYEFSPCSIHDFTTLIDDLNR